jgi:hypothetical protein
MSKEWWEEEAPPSGYLAVEAKQGRQFILRMVDGVDLIKTIQRFAMDYNISIAKIHAAFMGGLKPAKYEMWTPIPGDHSRLHEEPATLDNLSMILSMGLSNSGWTS